MRQDETRKYILILRTPIVHTPFTTMVRKQKTKPLNNIRYATLLVTPEVTSSNDMKKSSVGKTPEKQQEKPTTFTITLWQSSLHTRLSNRGLKPSPAPPHRATDGEAPPPARRPRRPRATHHCRPLTARLAVGLLTDHAAAAGSSAAATPPPHQVQALPDLPRPAEPPSFVFNEREHKRASRARGGEGQKATATMS